MTAPQLEAEAIYTLSPMQEAILFQSRRAAEAGMYVGQMTCVLRGNIDFAAFRQAWEDLVARHAALRTAFVYEGVDAPLQYVRPRVELPMPIEDLRELPAGEAAERVERFLAVDRLQAFDVRVPPLMRIHLFRLGEQKSCFVLTRHHIIFDGWSANLLLREFMELYAASRAGQQAVLPPTRPYQVFVHWMRRQDLGPARQFWREQLVGFREPSDLSPSQISRGEMPAVSLEEEKLELDAVLAGAIGGFARRVGITEATFFTAAWGVLLSRYSGKDDVLFGLTLSGRPGELRGVESIVGLFLNTLPIRIAMAPSHALMPWIQELHRQLEDVRNSQHVPLVDLRALTEVPSARELFDHILVIENYPAAADAGVAGIELEEYRFVDQTNFPLNIGVVVDRGVTTLAAVYDPSRYSRRFAGELLEDFAVVVRSLAGKSEGARLADVECLADRQRLPANETARDWTGPVDVVEAIRECAVRYPDAIAVTDSSGSLTHSELAAASDALHGRLAELDVRSESIVAICAESSLELVVSIVAVLKSGGAWLPLDPADPVDRLASLLRDSGACVVLAQPQYLEKLNSASVPVLAIDSGTARQRANRDRAPHLNDLQAAYVIYTSGSTGRPKPVVNHHGGLMNRLLWMQSAYPISPADRILQKTSYTFDVSVWEFLWPLMYGATLFLAEPGGNRDAGYLRDFIIREGITVVHFVPSMLKQFVEQPDIEQCTSLRHVICSGEALGPALSDRFHQRLTAQLHNLYGPTEAAIDVTYHDCSRAETSASVPIGRPIANASIHIFNRHMRPVPRGVIGEMFIGGCGLARGYHAQPEQTADRFVPDPFSVTPGGRLYRTGDLGRWSETGEIEYCGRADFQIKLRGIRVEPGEIEAAIRQCRGIQDCAVLADASAGEMQLIAHVVPKEWGIVDTEGTTKLAAEIRAQLADSLPVHLIPVRFVFHEAFPLTRNGKLDRHALGQAGGTSTFAAVRRMEAPRTEIEVALVEIWKEVLGVDGVGIRENFFELGGHSLSLAQVAARVNDRLGVSLPLRDLFNAQTVAQMAEAIVDRELAQADPEELRRLTEEVQGLTSEEVDQLLAE